MVERFNIILDSVNQLIMIIIIKTLFYEANTLK